MSTENRWFAVLGCVFLTAAGALGAYGVHGLAATASAADRAAWNWAVEMQYYHGLGLVAVGLLGARIGQSLALRAGGVLMVAGVLIFSGLIYAQQLGAPPFVGELVPTGGLSFMLSWLAVALAVLRAPR